MDFLFIHLSNLRNDGNLSLCKNNCRDYINHYFSLFAFFPFIILNLTVRFSGLTPENAKIIFNYRHNNLESARDRAIEIQLHNMKIISANNFNFFFNYRHNNLVSIGVEKLKIPLKLKEF